MDGAMDVLNILACLRAKSIAAETAKDEANAAATHFETASHQLQRKNAVLFEQTTTLRKRLDIEHTFRKDAFKLLDDAENIYLRETGRLKATYLIDTFLFSILRSSFFVVLVSCFIL